MKKFLVGLLFLLLFVSIYLFMEEIINVYIALTMYVFSIYGLFIIANKNNWTI